MKAVRLLPLMLMFCSAPATAATEKTMKLRCEKARAELKLVDSRLAKVNPEYAGDLKREKALWEKQIGDNCYVTRHW